MVTRNGTGANASVRTAAADGTATGGALVEVVGGLALPLVFVAVVGGGLLYWQHHRRKVLFEGLRRLAARDRLELTDRPCGLERRQFAGRFDATPKGDRRNGLRHGVHGPVTVELDGRPVQVQIGCFEWWWEVRNHTQKGSHYTTSSRTVAVVRLPVVVPGQIRLKPEGLLGRVGLRRADQQLESEEFNRRFNVWGSDPHLTIRFLDASMQHRLLQHATGRFIHLERDLLVLGGSPDHRDGSLPGVIGELPAVAQDALGLLRSVPAQVWRTTAPIAPPDPPTSGTAHAHRHIPPPPPGGPT